MKLLKLLSFTCCLFFLSSTLVAQGIFTGINNTVINLPCSQTCTNLNFQIPHLKSDDDYQVVSIPYTPYPYTTPLGNELTALYADDKYSQAITLPFPICFYGAVYNQVVVGSNGLLTFDVANASCDGAYTVSQTIPFAGGVICSQNSTYYPRAAIMGAYSDLDPQPSASPLGRKIEWRFEGTAPFRRFVASWNRVGVFGNPGCSMINPTTFQIVINESTGAIEVFFERKNCTDGSNGGRTILGVQDWNRTKAVAAPGKNAVPWNANNEGYRFVPSGTTSRFVSSQLFLPDGVTLVANATTTTTAAGLLDISFGNVCPPGTSQQYIVRTTYSSCLNPTIPIVIDDIITVNRSIGLGATAVTTNTLCGAPSGTIEVIVPPGIGVSPYIFVLDGGTPVVAPSPYTFTNVGQGVHTVIVTDASVNCTSTITNIPVNRTNNLAATLTPSITSCSSVSDGRIAVAPQNGSAPYTFFLNPGGITQTGATTTFTGLAPNTYTVTVTDASGCSTAALSTQVNAGPAYTTVVTATDARCYATPTGSITVTPPASGTAPFQYSLDGVTWQASNVFNNLLANSYTVYFREANGCQGSQMSVVNQPPPLSATVAAVPVICNGQNNGTITVTPAGGTAPYQYSIDGGTNWQASNIFNVIANPYTVTIRDNNNCITTQQITVTEPAALTGSYIATNATCNGGNDGTITITALGGNGIYEYSIDGINWQSSNVFNVAPAPYTVRVRDNLGCNIQFPATVALTNDLVLTPQIDPTICESKSTQLALISNATKYAWSPAIGLSDTTIFNPVANPTVTTQYTVTATLGRCTATDIVMVNVNAAPIPNAGQDAFICYGQTYTLQASGGVQFTWTPATFLNSTSGANPISNPSKTITYTLAKVVDALGCESLTTDDMVLDVTPPIKVTTFPFDTIGYPGDQFQLQAIAAVPAANIFKWSPATRLSDANSFNPQVTVGNIGDDVLYQVTASTPAGCKGEGFVRIRVYKGPDIYVPTGFTPNGDGKNDRFIPFPVGMKSISYFRVFNRWGQPVYTSAQINQGWDGTINGVPQAAGTYVWMVQGVTKDNKTITKKGVVTLIR